MYRMQSMDDIILRAVDNYFIMVEKAGFSGPVFFVCSFFIKKESARLVNTTGQCCLRKRHPFYIIKISISATVCATLRGAFEGIGG